MLQVFYLDVLYVAMAIHVCCKCMFQTFHLFQMYVIAVLSRCSICLSGYTHMLRASMQNILSVPDICCKYIYLDVVVDVHICCKCMFINISLISNLCCRSASYFNISRRKKRAHAEAVPTCATSKAGVGGPHLHAHQQACGTQLHADAAVCGGRRADATVACEAGGQAPFHFWSALISCGNRACRGKIVVTNMH
jgi:hypothetical protein